LKLGETSGRGFEMFTHARTNEPYFASEDVSTLSVGGIREDRMHQTSGVSSLRASV